MENFINFFLKPSLSCILVLVAIVGVGVIVDDVVAVVVMVVAVFVVLIVVVIFVVVVVLVIVVLGVWMFWMLFFSRILATFCNSWQYWHKEEISQIYAEIWTI